MLGQVRKLIAPAGSPDRATSHSPDPSTLTDATVACETTYVTSSRVSRRLACILAAAVICSVPAHADAKKRARNPLCSTLSKRAKGPVVAVFSAFPAEAKALVAATKVESTIELGGRPYYLGRIGRVRVVLGLLGIGMINAEKAAIAVLDGLDVAGVIVSGVAGSNQRIADVVISDDWVSDRAPGVFPANVAMLALAHRAQTSLPDPFERCTRVPPTSPSGAFVCMPFEPALVFGGRGMSGDDYATATPCGPDENEILGCALPPPTAALLASSARLETVPEIVDQETAAVARVAMERDVPFLGIRAVSDGAGDPNTTVRPPFAQFFDYYQLAANNAAIVTRAVVAEIEGLKGRTGRRTCRLLAKHKWEQAAARLGQ